MRKVKLVRINPIEFMDLFRTGSQHRVLRGLPDDAKFVRLDYDIMTDQYCVTVSSETFPEVPLGNLLETVDIQVATYA